MTRAVVHGRTNLGAAARAVAILAAGCAGGAAPSPTREPTPRRPPIHQAASCADVAALVRGDLSVGGVITSEDAKRGPSKQAMIERTCEQDRWTPEVLACVTSHHVPLICLDDLTEDQRTSYDAAVERWSEAQRAAATRDLDVPPALASCAEVVDHVDLFAPTMESTPDRAVAIQLRGEAIERVCHEERWGDEVRRCLRDAAEPAPVAACRERLHASSRAKVDAGIAAADRIASSVTTMLSRPATHTCERVVVVHYASARWRGRAIELTGGARRRAIDGSRTRLREACTRGQWSASSRACVVAGGGPACFDLAGSAVALWGYPAAGSIAREVAECARLFAALDTLPTCRGIEAAERGRFLDAIARYAAAWDVVPADRREPLASACEQAAGMVEHGLEGCR